MRGVHLTILAASLLLAVSTHAFAQGAAPRAAVPEAVDACPGLVSLMRRPPVIPAAIGADEVRITYAGHSTFLLESPQLVRVATDFNDWVRPSVLPDIVTMNHAHSSHYTDRPDPGIKHVLRGWADNEKPARIDVQFKDVRVRNVPTNIRTFGGDTERHGNSVFIFETANLCIAHLGHLHHTLTPQQLAEIGKVDVVMVPVDGGATLDLDGMIDVLRSLKAQVMIPMHFFSSYTLDRFLARARQEWDVETADIPSALISKASLPAKPKILVLHGR